MNFLIYLLTYVFFLIVWTLLCIIFYSIGIIFKKNLSAVPYAINYVLNVLIGFYIAYYPLYLIWQFIKYHQWFYLVLVFIAGSFIINIVGGIIGLLSAPFSFISTYFMEKLDSTVKIKNDDFDMEYISPDGKVIEKTSSDGKIDRNLAFFFILSFANNLLYILLRPEKYSLIGLDYIFTPGFFMLQNILIFGVIFGIYELIKHRKFIYPTWKVFLTNVFKIELTFTIGIQVLATAYLLLFSS